MLQANAELQAQLQATKTSKGGGELTPRTPSAPTIPAPSPRTPAGKPSPALSRKKSKLGKFTKARKGKQQKQAKVLALEDANQEGHDEEDNGDDVNLEEEEEEEENQEEAANNNEGPGEEPTEAAKNNRLRRLCEKKPSGRMNVPAEINEIWARGGDERLNLRDQLESCGWDKDGLTGLSLLL